VLEQRVRWDSHEQLRGRNRKDSARSELPPLIEDNRVISLGLFTRRANPVPFARGVGVIPAVLTINYSFLGLWAWRLFCFVSADGFGLNAQQEDVPRSRGSGWRPNVSIGVAGSWDSASEAELNV
jgi:hypothetical protein